MLDDDRAGCDVIKVKLQPVSEKTARLRRKLDRIEADLTRATEMLLQATGRRDLALDFLRSLGKPRPTLH
jgi:hypothetical protein